MVRRVSEIAFVGIVALGVAYYAATTLPIGLSQLSSAAAHRPAQPGGQPAPAAPARSTTTTSVGAVRSVAKAPSTIDTTCRADVTSAILTWVASVPDGSTVTFTKNACYRVEGSLTFQGRHGLTFEGNGATFKSTTLGPLDKRGHSQRRHFWFVDCQNITVRNINVVGNNTRSDNGRAGFASYDGHYEFEHAFALAGSSHVLLQNLKADAIWGDGLYIGGGKPSTDVTVQNLTVDRNGRQGVGMAGADGVVLDHVTLLHSRRSGFDMEPPPGYVRNIEIRNSYVYSVGPAFSAAGEGDVSNIYIHDNTIDGQAVPWVYMKASNGFHRHDWRVIHNTVLQRLGSPAPALKFWYVDNVEIRDNVSHIATTRSRVDVYFAYAHGALTVIGNDFDGACAPYVAGEDVGPVTASGNKTSTCT